MIIPIKCFSCGKPVAHLWDSFTEGVKKKKVEKVLDDLGLERQCCRALFLGHVDMIKTISKYRK
ncbi:MAG: DNA-directed RNA polymerase subunit N [Nanoarchaeota archaeon]|nr:DNA-directed RNA polymerase subunit N [Nanoarchaeota archaeon]